MTEPRMTEPSGGGALLDVNVLVALVLDQHVHHVAAHRQFAGVAERWFTTPLTEAGLLRLLLTPAVAGREVAGAEALAAFMPSRGGPTSPMTHRWRHQQSRPRSSLGASK